MPRSTAKLYRLCMCDLPLAGPWRTTIPGASQLGTPSHWRATTAVTPTLPISPTAGEIPYSGEEIFPRIEDTFTVTPT